MDENPYKSPIVEDVAQIKPIKSPVPLRVAAKRGAMIGAILAGFVLAGVVLLVVAAVIWRGRRLSPISSALAVVLGLIPVLALVGAIIAVILQAVVNAAGRLKRK